MSSSETTPMQALSILLLRHDPSKSVPETLLHFADTTLINEDHVLGSEAPQRLKNLTKNAIELANELVAEPKKPFLQDKLGPPLTTDEIAELEKAIKDHPNPKKKRVTVLVPNGRSRNVVATMYPSQEQLPGVIYGSRPTNFFSAFGGKHNLGDRSEHKYTKEKYCPDIIFERTQDTSLPDFSVSAGVDESGKFYAQSDTPLKLLGSQDKEEKDTFYEGDVIDLGDGLTLIVEKDAKLPLRLVSLEESKKAIEHYLELKERMRERDNPTKLEKIKQIFTGKPEPVSREELDQAHQQFQTLSLPHHTTQVAALQEDSSNATI